MKNAKKRCDFLLRIDPVQKQYANIYNYELETQAGMQKAIKVQSHLKT